MQHNYLMLESIYLNEVSKEKIVSIFNKQNFEDVSQLNDKELKNKIIEFFSDYGIEVMLTKEEVVSKNIIFQIKKKVEILNEYGVSNDRIKILVKDSNYLLTDDEIKNIEELDKYLNRYEEAEKNIELGFFDHSLIWGLKDVKNANNQLKEMLAEIKEKNLSPLEQLITTYSIVTRRQYKEEEYGKPYGLSRSIYGILNTDYIVCQGYAELFDTLTKIAGNNNVKTYLNAIDIQDDIVTDFDSHTNIIAYLKDTKYNIEGFYYLDPTWDFQFHKGEYRFNNFLVPLKDIKNYVDLTVRRNPNLDDMRKYNGGMFSSSISSEQFIYHKSLIKDILSSKMFNNTVIDIIPYALEKECNNCIAKLTNLLNIKEFFINNEAILKKELNEYKNIDSYFVMNDIVNNKNELSVENIKTILEDNNNIDEIKTILEDNNNKKTKLLIPTYTYIVKHINKRIKNTEKEFSTLCKLEQKLKNGFKLNSIVNKIKPGSEFYTSLILDNTLKYLGTTIPLKKLKSALNFCFNDKKFVDNIINKNLLVHDKFFDIEKSTDTFSEEIKEKNLGNNNHNMEKEENKEI